MAQLQVSVVGVGPRGLGHLDVLSAFDDVRLAAVCDPVAEARDAAGDDFGVPGRYASVEKMLDSETLDAVFVAAPTHLNAVAALPCLRRGVNTLLEKPPGMSPAETVELRDAAAASGAIGMVGWDRRFNPMVVAAREMVESRGPITQLVGEFHKSMSRLEAGGERHAKVVMDNMLYETPIHSIDLVRALAGSEVAEVHSVVRRAFSQYKDVHAALVLFQNGCVAQITANYTTDARLERYEIHGRDVSAYLEGVRQGHVMRDGQRVELEYTGGSSTSEQARHFLGAVRDGKPVGPPTSTRPSRRWSWPTRSWPACVNSAADCPFVMSPLPRCSAEPGILNWDVLTAT